MPLRILLLGGPCLGLPAWPGLRDSEAQGQVFPMFLGDTLAPALPGVGQSGPPLRAGKRGPDPWTPVSQGYGFTPGQVSFPPFKPSSPGPRPHSPPRRSPQTQQHKATQTHNLTDPESEVQDGARRAKPESAGGSSWLWTVLFLPSLAPWEQTRPPAHLDSSQQSLVPSPPSRCPRWLIRAVVTLGTPGFPAGFPPTVISTHTCKLPGHLPTGP